jgi:hypothetical protein
MIGLISCGAAKTKSITMARSLYIGPVFMASKTYIERRCVEWAILSAKHHLLMPTTIVEPYDLTLTTMAKAQRDEWSRRTKAMIQERWPSERFLVIAGDRYAGAIEGLDVVMPFKGLSLGRLLGALSKENKQ